MLIDGEKYACEACVRGHRVSNCQHSDRPLQHINKKGRPVSQCQHCRAMRKSRASHVKCDCGEKTHKCQHLQQAVEGHDESCCCNHGGRCTCSHKKEIGQVGLDTVPESDSDEDSLQSRSMDSLRRRRAQTAISEPVLNFDENGRHKPAQKHNKAAQKTGPYSLSRGDSMHSGLANKSMENLLVRPRPSRKSTLDSLEFEQRATKSEAASPLPFQPLNLTGQLPPLDLSNIQYPEYTPSFDFFAGLSDSETPIYSAGLSAASVDWADYNGLDLNGDNFAPSSYDQSLSYTGFDFSSTEPTLASNSGDVSENEDLMPAFSEQQMEGFRQSAATNYMNMPQSQPSMLGANGELGNVNYDQFKGAGAANKFLPNIPTPDDVAARMPYLEEDTYFPMNNDFYDGLGQSPDPAASQFWGRQ